MNQRHLLTDSIKRLRRGWGLRIVRSDHVDPALRAVCHISEQDSDEAIQKKILDAIVAALPDLPDPPRLTARVQLGIHPDAQFKTLTERARWLEERLGGSERTIVRRMDEALEMLAASMWRQRRNPQSRVSTDEAYYVRSFNALLKLDGHVPEALEERAIVAVQDGLDELETSISVPRHRSDETPTHGLEVEMLYGGRIESREQPYESFFRQVIVLPEPLKSGQEHEYLLRTRLPIGQQLAPHYVHVPFRRSDHFALRVLFDPTQIPETIWKLSGVPTAVIYEREPTSEIVKPNRFGEVFVEFRGLTQGLGYGICWSDRTVLPEDSRER